MIKLHDLQPSEGSNKRGKRKARGIGGKGGKTAGRGTKGQRARNTVPLGFEDIPPDDQVDEQVAV